MNEQNNYIYNIIKIIQNPQQKFIEIFFEMSICTLYCNFISFVLDYVYKSYMYTKVFFTLSTEELLKPGY